MDAAAPIRESAIDWEGVRSHLDERGFALIRGVFSKPTCEEIAGYYADDRYFRSRIEMSRYAFGQGEYKYFKYPLPGVVQQYRSSIYSQLAPLANRWAERLGSQERARILKSYRLSSSNVTVPAKSGQRRCCSNTAPAISTACIRICTAKSSFRFK